jgi:multiple sugar transport system substrate-binding protein
MNQKLTVALASGTGPDIMDADASYYVAYYAKGILEPANLDVFGVKTYPELAARYVSGGLASGTFDGKIYTLPYQGNSMSLFINNKLFAAAGLDPKKDAPKTWKDVMALGPKLKKVDGKRTTQKAFEFPYHSPRWQLQDLQPLTEQFGGKLLSDDGKTAYLNSPEALKALTLWRDVTKACGVAQGPVIHMAVKPSRKSWFGLLAVLLVFFGSPHTLVTSRHNVSALSVSGLLR